MAVRHQRPVGAVIVHHEAPGDLERCLAALLGGRRTPDRIAVVDNSEDEGSRAAAATVADRAGAVLVEPGRNLGFGAGCNRGAAAIGGCASYLFINQDAEVGADGLALLVDGLDRQPALGAINPLIVTQDGRVWFAGGGYVPSLARLTLPAFGEPSALVTSTNDSRLGAETDWLNGCALLVRAEAWDQVGGFDERYFLYWEDVELSLRLIDAGWSLGLEPGTEVVHHRSTEGDGLRTLTPLAVEHAIASRLLFVRHHLGRRHRLTAWPYTIVNALRLLALAARHQGPPLGRHVGAVAAGLRRGMGA